ncbi:hypothetical protein H6761_03285 [Candidatus Nomurabacteria bacterium]|nr:hypothetical protein [Candidatus Nomurabacteria bacterium]
MAQADDRKIKDFLNTPDKDLLMLINKQYGTPNADLAKSILDYRLYDTMIELTQTFKETQKESIKHSTYMFWLAIFMASIALLQLIIIITPLLV